MLTMLNLPIPLPEIIFSISLMTDTIVSLIQIKTQPMISITIYTTATSMPIAVRSHTESKVFQYTTDITAMGNSRSILQAPGMTRAWLFRISMTITTAPRRIWERMRPAAHRWNSAWTHTNKIYIKRGREANCKRSVRIVKEMLHFLLDLRGTI